MNAESVAPFEGVAGRVLRATISLGSFLTGLGLAMVIGVIVFVFDQLDARLFGHLLVDLLLALVLARFALNGFAGEWEGTLFSNAGGSWKDAAGVTIRYLLLSLVWLVPFFLVELDPDLLRRMLMGPALGPRGVGMVLVLVAAAASPPIFLIASVAADRLSDLGRRSHWSGLFSGRLGELWVLYALWFGAMVVLGLLALLLVLAVAFLHVKIALAAGAVALIFLGGVLVTLLGRLCGFFAFLAEDQAGELFLTGPVEPDRPASRLPVARPLSPSEIPGSEPAPAVIEPPAGPGTSPGKPPSSSPLTAAVSPASRPGGAPPGTEPGRRPPLLNARERVEAILGRSKEDPAEAIRLLRSLRDDFAPAPAVLHALTMLHHRLGQQSEAVAVAREAIPHCMQRGNHRLVAEMIHALLDQAAQFGLDRDQTLTVAGTMRDMKYLAAAAKTYIGILDRDPAEVRAIKGLLQVGQAELQHEGDPGRALEVFDYLLRRCGDSPLGEFMLHGKQEAERMLARAHERSSGG